MRLHKNDVLVHVLHSAKLTRGTELPGVTITEGFTIWGDDVTAPVDGKYVMLHMVVGEYEVSCNINHFML